MIIKSSFFAILFFTVNVNAFNNSLEYYKDAVNNRSGKFLFDTLFGLELEEELINAASSPNTLKSCECGKLRDQTGDAGK